MLTTLHARSQLILFSALLALLPLPTRGEDTPPVACRTVTERPYTPNTPAIQAQIDKLSAFEADMRGTVTLLEQMSKEDAKNKLLGTILGYREIFNQFNRAACASGNLGSSIRPDLIVLQAYATACRAGEEVASGINDLIDCAMGDCLGAAYQFANGNTTRPDQKRVAELVKEGKTAVESALKGDKAGALAAGCSLVPDSARKVAKQGKEICGAATSLDKAMETVQVVQDLDEAAQQNHDRFVKQLAMLNGKISATSERIIQLRNELSTVNFGAMVKPDPNMTIMKTPECDDLQQPLTPKLTHKRADKKPIDGDLRESASPEGIEDAIAQMSRPSFSLSVRPDLNKPHIIEPDSEEMESSVDIVGTAAAILGGISQSIRSMDHGQKSQPQNTITPKQQQCVLGFNCLADLQRARERQAEENRQAAEMLQRQMKENEARLRERDRAANNSGLKGPSQNVPVKPCTGCGCSGRGNATC